jgi:inorganic pyrophosphatase
MLLRLCQLKSPFIVTMCLFLFGSCSLKKNERPGSVELMTTFSNDWFSVNKNHALVNSSGVPLPHLIFDTTPEFDSKAHTVNVIIATLKGSPHAYSVDLSSGQRHYSHTYCKQGDIWNSYRGTINRPEFSIGYIPRTLDQLGHPQKIIVWSKSKEFLELAPTNYSKVRVIGAYVEQICPDRNCIGKSNWLSRLVFIGVDARDPDFKKIKNLTDFKKTFDWETSKAILENIDGHNSIGEKRFPSIKVARLVEYKDAYEYFKKRSLALSDVELKKIQKGCHLLYDKFWEEVGERRPEDKPATNAAELKAKLKLIASLKKEKKPVGFAARLKKFTNKYYNEVTTCEKFVYHGNINRNRKAFWFLSYMGIYYRLHKEGYFFNCQSKNWQRNVLNVNGEMINNFVRDLKECSEADIDQAMSYLPNFLTGLKGESDYYRFFDYDNHAFGTHNKIYSWVKLKSPKFDCGTDPNDEIRKELQLFPEDVQWMKRDVKDYINNEKIIR